MITTKLLIAVFTSVLLITAAVSARGNDFACPTAAPAKVQINLRRGTEQVETDISLQQVQEVAKGRHPGPVLGLYVGTLRYEIAIDDTIRQLPPASFCATPKYVTLTVQLDREIHIPREFVGDPCLTTLARDHETKHADAEVMALVRSRSSLVSAIRQAVRANAATASASRQDALAMLTTGIRTAIDQEFDNMAIERRRLDAAVGGPAELERLKTGCGGRAARWFPATPG
jgi:hypothetical protein